MSLKGPHRPSKRLGQHFLKDLDIAREIVSAARLDKTDTVLEPGPGHGVITRLLENKAGHVIAVEKDRRLAAELRDLFSNSPSVEVLEGDVLKIRLPNFNKVVGTPPYNISSRLVLMLQRSNFAHASLVFQKEFADRLVAQPGTSDYGRLSVTAQRSMTTKSLLRIPRESFFPKPKIDSVLVSIEPKPHRVDIDNIVLGEIVRGIFTQRRRLVRGAVFHFLKLKFGRQRADTILSSLTLPKSRVYELSVSEFEDIALQLTPFLLSHPF